MKVSRMIFFKLELPIEKRILGIIISQYLIQKKLFNKIPPKFRNFYLKNTIKNALLKYYRFIKVEFRSNFVCSKQLYDFCSEVLVKTSAFDIFFIMYIQQNKNRVIKKSITEKELHLNAKVRLCFKEDIPKLEWFGMYWEHRNIFQQQYQRHLNKENIMLVADVNNFPAGQVWVDLKTLLHESTAVIWALRVHPILQNLGLGTLLIKSSEDLIRKKKISYALIDVEKENTKAKLLYERLGYIGCGEHEEEWSFISPSGYLVEGKSCLVRMRKKTGF